MSRTQRHLASVNETYFQHWLRAAGFGVRMVGGGLACIAHATFPAWFEHTGSHTIRRLHESMVTHRVVNARSSAADLNADLKANPTA